MRLARHYAPFDSTGNPNARNVVGPVPLPWQANEEPVFSAHRMAVGLQDSRHRGFNLLAVVDMTAVDYQLETRRDIEKLAEVVKHGLVGSRAILPHAPLALRGEDDFERHTVPNDLRKLAGLRPPDATDIAELLISFKKESDPLGDEIDVLRSKDRAVRLERALGHVDVAKLPGAAGAGVVVVDGDQRQPDFVSSGESESPMLRDFAASTSKTRTRPSRRASAGQAP